jgi:hypothetical protein
MLAHCRIVLQVALKHYDEQFLVGKLLGKTIVQNILNDKTGMKKNIKSSKKLFEMHPKSFEEEQNLLLQVFDDFHEKGSAFFEDKLHPVFGRLTASQWYELTYKHLNHHLSQFSS